MAERRRTVWGGTLAEPAEAAVTTLRVELPGGHWFEWHRHPHPQLIWAARGVIVLEACDRVWVLPPARAVWMPAGTLHRDGATADAAMRLLGLPEVAPPGPWQVPTCVAVSPLVAALVEHLTGLHPQERRRSTADALLLEQLVPTDGVDVSVPAVTDSRLVPIRDALFADPADDRDLDCWGRVVGASARHLARLFRAETGLTFAQWRRNVRMRAALSQLVSGRAPNQVAHRVGYSSTSAFIAAFRGLTGHTPGQIFHTGAPAPPAARQPVIDGIVDDIVLRSDTLSDLGTQLARARD